MTPEWIAELRELADTVGSVSIIPTPDDPQKETWLAASKALSYFPHVLDEVAELLVETTRLRAEARSLRDQLLDESYALQRSHERERSTMRDCLDQFVEIEDLKDHVRELKQQLEDEGVD